jgi:four helix bundle protein
VADHLVIEVYRLTQQFPRHEAFGLVSQMRRSATSVACNIVGGSTRRSQSDYVRFLELSLGSAKELAYQLTIAERLGYLIGIDYETAHAQADEQVRMLAGMIGVLTRARASCL